MGSIKTITLINRVRLIGQDLPTWSLSTGGHCFCGIMGNGINKLFSRSKVNLRTVYNKKTKTECT